MNFSISESGSIWTQKPNQVFEKFSVNKECGLSLEEAQKRLAKNGPNTFEQERKHPIFRLFLSQLENWIMIVLLIAAVIALFLGETLEAVVIFVLVFLNVFVGFFQEYRAENALKQLRQYVSHTTNVLRDSIWKKVDSQELVVGDIIELSTGDIIPADMRLFEVEGFLTNESVLTGESIAVTKQIEPLKKEQAQPYELSNMALMGTTVQAGWARGVVISTGVNSFFGRAAHILAKEEPPTEFQKQTKHFGKFLFQITWVMTIFVFIVNAVLQKGLFDSFLFAVALAVGIAPEILPAIFMITLSKGALEMARKKVIVKRLMSVEDFGNIDTLCVDKTGTLTEGNFVFCEAQGVHKVPDSEVLRQALLCTTGFGGSGKLALTNATDQALWQSDLAKTLLPSIKHISVLEENEFDYERRRIGMLVRDQEQTMFIVKGAFESILPICLFTSDTQKHDLQNKAQVLEQQGYRVIAVCHKQMQEASTVSIADEIGMNFSGFLLFQDPLKTGVKDSLERLKNLGIQVKILSGDSLTVTKTIASLAGFSFTENEIIDGQTLAKLKKEDFEKRILECRVFARVSPEQKYQIVSSLNKEGHVVGFLGDGVNDAPALRAADIGIAVDTGADVSKQAADIILLQKDLNVLALGIVQGRKTFGNIMKYILNTMSANTGNMFTVSVSSLFLPFIPMLPSQILLNNFLSDIPLLAVATDRVDDEFVHKPKRWDFRMIRSFMFYFGFISTFFDLVLIVPLIIFGVSPDVFRTAWFIESSLSEIFITFSIRTRLPFYKSIPSLWLLGLSILISALIIIIPAMSFGQFLFTFASMPLHLWAYIGLVVILYFTVIEISKRRFFKKWQ